MSGCTLAPIPLRLSTMSTKKADARLKIIRHITLMLLAISDDDESLTEAELDDQYNNAEEWADLLLESIGFTQLQTQQMTILLRQPTNLRTSRRSSKLSPRSIW